MIFMELSLLFKKNSLQIFHTRKLGEWGPVCLANIRASRDESLKRRKVDGEIFLLRSYASFSASTMLLSFLSWESLLANVPDLKVTERESITQLVTIRLSHWLGEPLQKTHLCQHPSPASSFFQHHHQSYSLSISSSGAALNGA